MSGKEAARTTTLSKSWYNSWLTRPNLVFDYFSNYGLRPYTQEFSNFSKKTLQRYRDLNLNIDSFKCVIMFSDDYSVANELTVEAIKMGATNISLSFRGRHCLFNELTVEASLEAYQFVMPGDVLESESLIRLSLMRCKMEGVKVNCSMLKYLCLHQVFLEGDLLWDIISSCPLIEGLELRECRCGLKTNKKLLNFSKHNLGLFELHKLKNLLLEKVKICSSFFINFSSRFPCLKDLSVHECSGYENLQIYSQSLEFISFKHFGMIFQADFDVPNLRKFCYSGQSSLPSVSFPNSCNWESTVYISLWEDDHISAKWFLNLNKLLIDLSLSKVSLNLQSFHLGNIDKAGNTSCLPRPSVENLTIFVQSSDYAITLLDSLIQWCRPIFVTRDHTLINSFIYEKRGIESLEIVYKILMQQRNSVDDLEEVSVGVFDETVCGWRTIPWKSLLETSTSRLAKQRIRFHLRWRQH